MSLSKQVDEFTKSIQDILQTKQTTCFDAKAQKQSDEVNKKFKLWGYFLEGTVQNSSNYRKFGL